MSFIFERTSCLPDTCDLRLSRQETQFRDDSITILQLELPTHRGENTTSVVQQDTFDTHWTLLSVLTHRHQSEPIGLIFYSDWPHLIQLLYYCIIIVGSRVVNKYTSYLLESVVPAYSFENLPDHDILVPRPGYSRWQRPE